MLKKILVPLDGSPLAEEILPLVWELACALRGEVLLFQSLDPETLDPQDPQERRYLEEIRWLAKPQAEEYLRRIARTGLAVGAPGGLPGPSSHPEPSPVRTRVALGAAPQEILRCAQEEEVGLIAMATHGRSGLSRWVLGSVADRVLQGSPIPVLLYRPGGRPKEGGESLPRPLIVPLDGSSLAEGAIPYGEEIARALDLDLLLIRAVQYEIATQFGLYVQDHRGLIEKTARDYLADVRTRLKDRGLRATQVLLWGMAAEQIIDFSQEARPRLIIMSTHGRSGIGRWVLGSVADKVVRGSGVPVLIIPVQPTGRATPPAGANGRSH